MTARRWRRLLYRAQRGASSLIGVVRRANAFGSGKDKATAPLPCGTRAEAGSHAQRVLARPNAIALGWCDACLVDTMRRNPATLHAFQGGGIGIWNFWKQSPVIGRIDFGFWIWDFGLGNVELGGDGAEERYLVFNVPTHWCVL